MGAPSLLCPPLARGSPAASTHFVFPPGPPAYLPRQTPSPPAARFSQKPYSQRQYRVPSSTSQLGWRREAGSPIRSSGGSAAAGRARVRAAPPPPGRPTSGGAGEPEGSPERSLCRRRGTDGDSPRPRRRRASAPTGRELARALHRRRGRGEARGLAHTWRYRPKQQFKTPLLEGSFSFLKALSFLFIRF